MAAGAGGDTVGSRTMCSETSASDSTAVAAEIEAGSESDRSATPAEPPRAASIMPAPIIVPTALRRNAPTARLP
jgi:hypothetical protein